MDAEARRRERQRALAQALMGAQAPQGQMAGGFYVAPNPLERLATLGSQWAGGRLNRRLDKEDAQAEAAERQRIADTLRRLGGGGGGAAPGGEQGPQMRQATIGGMPPEPPQDPRQAAAMEAFQTLPLEAQRQVVAGRALETMFPKAPKIERVDAGDSIVLLDEAGREVGRLPKGATPDAVLGQEGQDRRHLTPSGNARLTADTTRRGQDLSYDAQLRGQDVTMRGQDLTDIRAREQMDIDRANKGTGKPLTEFQTKAVGQLSRMQGAEEVIQGFGDYVPSISAKAAAGVPAIGNKLTSAEFQNYQQAAREWISGVLRLDSGAAVPETEFERYFATYFAQPGDGPEVMAQKADARQRATEALRGSLVDIEDRLPPPPAPREQQPAQPTGPQLSEGAMRYLDLPSSGAGR